MFEEPRYNHSLTQDEYKHQVSDVWKTTGILSAITILEVAFAIAYDVYLIPKGAPQWFLMLVVSILSIVKAYFIMFIFMHVKHEKKGFVLTIFIPFTLLIWAIIAFLWEGSFWHYYQSFLNAFS